MDVLLFLTALFGLGGLGMLVAGLVLRRGREGRLATWPRVPGRIIDVDVRRSSERNDSTSTLVGSRVVAYTDRSGTQRVWREQGASSAIGRELIDQPVELALDPADPSRAMIASGGRPLYLLVLVGMGAALMLIAAVLGAVALLA